MSLCAEVKLISSTHHRTLCKAVMFHDVVYKAAERKRAFVAVWAEEVSDARAALRQIRAFTAGNS